MEEHVISDIYITSSHLCF